LKGQIIFENGEREKNATNKFFYFTFLTKNLHNV
jgi:hypothetical protein